MREKEGSEGWICCCAGQHGKKKEQGLPLDKWAGGSASGVKLVFGENRSYSE